MEDSVVSTNPISKKFRLGFGLVNSILCWGIIFYLLIFGNFENTLQTSALAWAFTTNILILIGFGIAHSFPNMKDLIK